MRVIGLSSGTSHDAIDAAAVDFLQEGETLVAELLGTSETPYSPELRALLVATLPPAVATLEQVCVLDTLIGQAFAEAAGQALGSLCGAEADLVCSHGQTVFHWVEGHVARGTLQLGHPAWIAERTGLPVVADVRVRDIAAGGQGAPLASILDALLLGDAPTPCAALNLGGIANLTILAPRVEPLAYDIGPGNALIDAAVAHLTGGTETYDRDGARAARGSVDRVLLGRLLDEPYYRLAPPKTTGKELFNREYLLARIGGSQIDGDDVVATVTALTVETVAREVERRSVETLVISGGGVRNPALLGALRSRLPEVEVRCSDELGLPAEAKEAILFALIGYLTLSGLPAGLPSCTGARRAAILGSITPGSQPLVLPPPAARIPRRLVVRTPRPARSRTRT